MTEKQQKPPIKVKMKIGDIEFEIESQENQLQSAVDKILSTVTEKLKDTQLTTTAENTTRPTTNAF